MSDGRSPSLADQLAQFSRPRFSPFDPETGDGLEVEEPRYGRNIEGGEYAAPGSRAAHEYGVVFRSDHETLADGMCRQARTHAVALGEHVPVLLQTITGRVRRPVYDDQGQQLDVMTFKMAGDDMLEPEVFEQVGQLRRNHARNYLAAVYYTTLRSSEGLRSLLLPEYTRAAIGAAEKVLARSVVYTPWERSSVSPELIDVLKKVGQVWLQCSRNVRVFVDAGLPETKIRLVHPAYDPQGLVAQIPSSGSRPYAMGDVKRFYNIGKWEPRKNQHGLIGAFLKAFRPGDRASLTMKVSWFGEWDGYPGHKDSVRVWLDDPVVRSQGWTAENVQRHLAVYDKQFTEEQMAKLHAMHHIYVSASFAEGWDYPAFDAKLAGNKLVYVGFGGAEDYASFADKKIPFTQGPVHPQYGWESGAQWAAYEHEVLVEALRRVEPKKNRDLESDLRLAHYSAERAGRIMFNAIQDLVRGVDRDLWAAAEASWRSDDAG